MSGRLVAAAVVSCASLIRRFIGAEASAVPSVKVAVELIMGCNKRSLVSTASTSLAAPPVTPAVLLDALLRVSTKANTSGLRMDVRV